MTIKNIENKEFKKLKELKRLKHFDFISFAVPLIDHLCPIKYSPNQKYDNEYFLKCLLDFVDSSTSWTVTFPNEVRERNDESGQI